MALLKSVDNVPGIDFYDYRDDAYYGKYQYRARFKLSGIHHTWYSKEVVDFENRCKATKGYVKLSKKELVKVAENYLAIKRFIEWRNQRRKEKVVTVRIENDTAAIFCNDLAILKTVESIAPDIEYDYSEVHTGNHVGVKYFVEEPKHSYRIYLKSRVIKEDFAKNLHDLINRTTELYPSKALTDWLKGANKNSTYGHNWRYRFSSSSHSIDYDNESTLSYLLLMHGEMFGKRYKLEKRPDTV